jgi:hypothetical protein
MTFLSGFAVAQTPDFSSRMAETYRATDHNYDLDCYYSYNKTWQLATPKETTVKGNNILSRTFELDNGTRQIDFVFSVKLDQGKVIYTGNFDRKVSVLGPVKRRQFYLPQLSDKGLQTEFETNKLMCDVNFAYAEPFPLYDGDYHINVHPHTVYDWQNRLKSIVENYLNDNKYTSLILLDAGNSRGNSVSIPDFFAGKEPNLVVPDYPSKLEQVPAEIPLIVSPAGNSRYEILAQNEINVTYTGGNHNYCIWNSARHILENLLNSRSTTAVNFRYDMSAIVAQVRGVERTGINFPRGSVAKSNLLKDLLSDKTLQAKYHKNYMYYFAEWLADEYSGMFRTYTVDYEAEGFKRTVTFQGKGTRDLKITFRYF